MGAYDGNVMNKYTFVKTFENAKVNVKLWVFISL